jgi:hypothetical protein
MSSNSRRRNFGIVAALALLALVSGLGFAARPTSPDTSAGQGIGHQVNRPGNAPAAAIGSSSVQSAPEERMGQVAVMRSIKNDTSPPLSSIKPLPAVGKLESERENKLRAPQESPEYASVDPVVQRAFGPLVMPTPIVSFEGVANADNSSPTLPPDTTGDVGRNHYVQWVNISFEIFNKSGTSLYGPAAGNTLWAGFGGPCQTTNDGDPIVQYDQLADRWLMSQFALPNYPSGPFYQCIAISTTGDPTGTWYRYQFEPSPGKMNDYPHFGVWPDAYYMTANLFSSGSLNFAGAGNYAFDRAKMLLGQPAAMVRFDLPATEWGGMLPSDLDGSALPPAGAPNYFLEVTEAGWDPPNTQADELLLYKFHVDWVTPANSTFTGPTRLATAPFDGILCSDNSGACVPQPGTGIRLHSLFDRLMYRLAYRNFGTHESLVVNHTVDANGANTGYTGVRWYEVRSPNAAPAIYQQGTYAPDANSRWMGSVAMDRNGNMAVGYSVSSGGLYPSIAYSGRLVSDPPGTLAQGEAMLIAGSGSQTYPTDPRWGDYTTLSVDPVDDCTFWYTNEYYPTTHAYQWHTRIGSFKFPSCVGGTPTPTRTATATRTRTATVTGTPPTATPTVTTCPMTFTDVHTTDYFYAPVRYLYCAGVISGYADNTFRPFNNTTRGQMTKIVVLGFGIPISSNTTPLFRDVPNTNPFFPHIQTAAEQNIVSGYACGGTGEPCPGQYFRPNNNVTRGQLSKIIVVAANIQLGWAIINPPDATFNDVPQTNPFYTFIETAYCHGIISGYADGTFRWGANATRGQIAKIEYLAILNETGCGAPSSAARR